MSEELPQNQLNGFPNEWAELQITQTLSLHQSLLEQHGALYRWILASRLTLNGGGAAAILSSDLTGFLGNFAAFVFAIGCIFAVFGAEKDQKALEAGIPPNIEMMGFWIKFKSTGRYEPDQLSQIIERSRAAGKQSGALVGKMSLYLFTVGISLALVGQIFAEILPQLAAK